MSRTVNVSSPGQSCWPGKRPWASSSAWAGPPAGVSPGCRGVCSAPAAHRTGPTCLSPPPEGPRALLPSHLVKHGAQDDGEQQQGDGRHHHDEPQLSDQRPTSLTPLRPLAKPFGRSGRSGTRWSCRLNNGNQTQTSESHPLKPVKPLGPSLGGEALFLHIFSPLHPNFQPSQSPHVKYPLLKMCHL